MGQCIYIIMTELIYGPQAAQQRHHSRYLSAWQVRPGSAVPVLILATGLNPKECPCNGPDANPDSHTGPGVHCMIVAY